MKIIYAMHAVESLICNDVTPFQAIATARISYDLSDEEVEWLVGKYLFNRK